jgi:voltage-gated potassium channel
MSTETRFERWLDRALSRAVTPRGAVLVVTVASTTITIVAGLTMSLMDHSNFPSLGLGLWWAVQTITTVGYGDHVPGTVLGRLVAGLVMLAGIGSLTVITAAITSSFVARSGDTPTPEDAETVTPEQLRRIDERLGRIESALSGRS